MTSILKQLERSPIETLIDPIRVHATSVTVRELAQWLDDVLDLRPQRVMIHLASHYRRG